MKEFFEIIPKTHWGRAIFLLFLTQIFSSAVASFEYFIINFSGILENVQNGCAKISNEIGWGAFFVKFIVYVVAQIINIGVFEIMIVWLLVYCVFRFRHNRDLVGGDFFWISVITVAIQYLGHIIASGMNGDISVNIASVVVFLFCALVAYKIFNLPTSAKSLPKDYLKLLTKTLVKSKMFLCVWFIYLCLIFFFEIANL